MGSEVRRVSGNVDGNYNHRPLIIVACILAIFGLIMFAVHRYYSLAHAIDDSLWGEFGDFIGGVVGTIIAYISIRLLIDTLKAQNNANAISREASKESLYVYRLQQFNDNYQMLIRLFRETADQFKDPTDANNKGLPYLKDKVKTLCDNFVAKQEDYFVKREKAISSFMKFYADNRDVASVYFRVLYRLLELIYGTRLYRRDKLKYAKILRSQISEAELFFIRYNAMTQNGDNMKKYLNQYNILKHLPELSLMEFSYWPTRITDKIDQNVIITYMIALRKSIIYMLTVDDSAEVAQIGGSYSVSRTISENYKNFILEIKRNAEQSEELLSMAFDKLTILELRDLFNDIISELFISYRFEEYMKHDEVIVAKEPNDAQQGAEVIKISVSAQRELVLYIDKDDNIVIEDDSRYEEL